MQPIVSICVHPSQPVSVLEHKASADRHAPGRFRPLRAHLLHVVEAPQYEAARSTLAALAQ